MSPATVKRITRQALEAEAAIRELRYSRDERAPRWIDGWHLRLSMLQRKLETA